MKTQYGKLFDEVHVSEKLRQKVMNIPAAEECTKYRHRRPLGRTVLLAACVSLFLVSSVLALAVIGGEGIQIRNIISEDKSSSYDAMWDVEPVTVSELSEDVQQIIREMREEEGYCFVDCNFSNWSEMEKYLGMKIPNPLQGQEWLKPIYKYVTQDTGERIQSNSSLFLVEGYNEELVQIYTCAQYIHDGNWIQIENYIDTEHMPSEYDYGHYWNEKVEFDFKTKETGSGKSVVLVSNDWSDRVQAYFVYENMPYLLTFWESKLYGNLEKPTLDETIDKVLACF